MHGEEQLAGRPPSTFVDDTRANGIVCLIGTLIAVIGIALGFVGSVLVLIFVAPTLSEFVQFVASSFSL